LKLPRKLLREVHKKCKKFCLLYQEYKAMSEFTQVQSANQYPQKRTKSRRISQLTALVLAVSAGAASLLWQQDTQAHHAFAAEFDGDKPVSLKGKITRLQWTNPHSWLYLDVENDGAVTNWAVEFGAPYALIQKGLRRTDFEIGSEVIVDGYLAKNGKPVANASSVRLPNGKDFFTAADDSPAAR